MRKAIFWGFTGTLVKQAPGNPLAAYPDAAATLALCAYKGYQNYLLAEGVSQPEKLLSQLCLEQFFPDRVVCGQVEFTGEKGDGIYRKAELSAHFPGMIWLVSADAKEIAGAKAAGWHTVQVHGGDGGADFACPTLAEVWRLL